MYICNEIENKSTTTTTPRFVIFCPFLVLWPLDVVKMTIPLIE